MCETCPDPGELLGIDSPEFLSIKKKEIHVTLRIDFDLLVTEFMTTFCLFSDSCVINL